MKCTNVYVYRMFIGPITKTDIGLPIMDRYTFACWVGGPLQLVVVLVLSFFCFVLFFVILLKVQQRDTSF